jgi:nucleotide-binding universal stress UspA family protein
MSPSRFRVDPRKIGRGYGIQELTRRERHRDISDISAVMTVEVDRRLAARQSRIALRRAITLCRKAQAKFVTRAEIGASAKTIDRIARDVGAHQIVMGTRGPGSLGNLFLGSVATKVVRLAEVPVTLVK